MISQVPEKNMHVVKWLLGVGWLTLILSLVYDPITPLLTDPNNLSSPFRTHPEIAADALKCIKIQGECLQNQADAYKMGGRIFWTMILPIGIIAIFVFGHEFWRRICPLSFFSQLPRALKFQRKQKIVNPDTGSVRYELAAVEKDSWLGRNYFYLQIGLFFLGLNVRLLFANGDGLAAFVFLLFTIGSAITVGYLFKGKSWCQYFCPMAPIQMFYTGPGGLLGSDAHLSPPGSITQSMCRTVDSSGQEKSACVSCQSPCFDIDAERSYWEGITRKDQKVLYYSYFGLMLGFYVYYFLYSGNWSYYYSGTWTHEPGLLSNLLKPGFYFFGQAIPIPKIIAAPLSLAIFGFASYFICQALENFYRGYLKASNKIKTEEQILHICFSLCTFISFNIFFAFAGRSNMALFPNWVVLTFNAFLICVSSFWLYQSLTRSKERYTRESLADSLRRQLNKLALDWSKILEGKTLKDLLPDEVYVLAKVLPGFKRSDRLAVYKGVLEEALEEGKAQSANSLELLKDVRKELTVTDEEHYSLLKELGIENPDILDTNILRRREEKLRIDGYRRGLELLLLELVESGISLQDAFERRSKQILALRQEYAITSDEQEQVLAEMLNQDGELLRKAEVLLAQLQDSSVCKQALTNLVSNPQASVYVLLRSTVREKQKLLVAQLLSILEILGDSPAAISIASSTEIVAADVVQELLKKKQKFSENLAPKIISLLEQSKDAATMLGLSTNVINTLDPSTETQFGSSTQTILGSGLTQFNYNRDTTVIGQQALPKEAIIDVLLELLQDIDPVIQAASLYALNQINPTLAQKQARQLIDTNPNLDWLIQETANQILGKLPLTQTKIKVPTLIAQIKEKGKSTRKVFQQSIITVGRSQDNDIVIPDNRISRQHAIFYLEEQLVSVKELASANGLRIGNETIRNQQKTLKQGDIVRLGIGDELMILVQWEMQTPQGQANSLTAGTLEKLLWLYESRLFRELQATALIELARNASIRIYNQNDNIQQVGDIASELLVLIEGQAESVTSQNRQTINPGQTIGELNVLSSSSVVVSVIATSPKTKVIAIDAKDLETVLTLDPMLSKELLATLSIRLQEALATSK
jgi:hypothetical protein